MLPDTSQPLAPTRWCFGACSKDKALKSLESCGVTAAQKKVLTRSNCWDESQSGLCLLPPSEFVLDLSPATREKLYSILARHPANSAQENPFRFRPETFMEWFADTGLGPEQLQAFQRLTYRQGPVLCFCDGAVLQHIYSPGDFARLVKALYEERTFLMRLRVGPESDVEGLIRYWGKGERFEVLRPLIESLTKIPGGGSLNISYVLPPFARLRLYTYPKASEPSAAAQNCFWTAMNFFCDRPDDRFTNAAYAQLVLARDYEPVSGAPTLGDVVSLVDGANRPLHMCVYLADQVVFTKNGKYRIDPWVLMKLPDVLADYESEHAIRTLFFRPRRIPST